MFSFWSGGAASCSNERTGAVRAASRRLCTENHFLIDRMEQYLKILTEKSIDTNGCLENLSNRKSTCSFFRPAQNCMVFFRTAASWRFFKNLRVVPRTCLFVWTHVNLAVFFAVVCNGKRRLFLSGLITIERHRPR